MLIFLDYVYCQQHTETNKQKPTPEKLFSDFQKKFEQLLWISYLEGNNLEFGYSIVVSNQLLIIHVRLINLLTSYLFS